MVTTTLDSLGVYTRCASRYPIALTVIHVFEIEGVDMAREIPKNRQQNINEEISAAAGDEENAKWRDEQCDEDQAKHRAGSSHFD